MRWNKKYSIELHPVLRIMPTFMIETICILLIRIFSQGFNVKYLTPGRGHFWPQGYYLNTLGSDALVDATYQISRL